MLRAINRPGISIAQLHSLAPILTKNLEVGSRLRNGSWDLDFSYFRSDSDYGTRIMLVDGAYQMAREKTRLDGFETALCYRLNDEHRRKISLGGRSPIEYRHALSLMSA
ncbi:TonB-dependent receptor [Pusillimonas sp. TS35]|uniref:TonB-dependent receptor n=1 Tax=Paracandidimonas lactea TaxID=2895524 RepID=UPI00136CEF4C|nr:TonB-dependent receptor [Paracandidimonas lactea]MYN14790.1 TonB-dependent receptor [Pusillimonas sp. TS35]